MIDCHAHLVDKKFKPDIDEVVKAAVSKVVVVPEWPSQFDDVFELYQNHPDFVLPALGLHPIKLAELPLLEAALEKYCDYVKCVGEVGLDFTTSMWKLDEAGMDEQRKVLQAEVGLARRFDLPMTVHSRTAHSETIELLRHVNAKRVALHAFGGTPSQAQVAVEAGYLFSIPPSFAIDDKVKGLSEAEVIAKTTENAKAWLRL